jgi:hypothetical protein
MRQHGRDRATALDRKEHDRPDNMFLNFYQNYPSSAEKDFGFFPNLICCTITVSGIWPGSRGAEVWRLAIATPHFEGCDGRTMFTPTGTSKANVALTQGAPDTRT